MWLRKTRCLLLCIYGISSFSSISYAISDEFLRLISNTTLEQEKIYESEKKIIEAIQDRKVDESDYKPIDDMRASKLYRMEIAKNLLMKCFLEVKSKKMLRVN